MTAHNYFYAVVLNKVSLEPNIVKQHEMSKILIREPNISTSTLVFQ